MYSHKLNNSIDHSFNKRHQPENINCTLNKNIPNMISNNSQYEKPKVSLPSLSETLPEYFDRFNHQSKGYSASSTPNSETLPSLNTLPIFHSNLRCNPYHHTNQREVDSFTALDERDKKPRIRRRYEEVERLYHCVYPGCHKSYGALNHLNSHIVTKGHGPKRTPHDFQDLRRMLKLREEGHYFNLTQFQEPPNRVFFNNNQIYQRLQNPSHYF